MASFGDEAIFYFCHAGGWQAVIRVPKQDWQRLATTFTRPRKLFRFVLGTIFGYMGELYESSDCSTLSDLEAPETASFYWQFPGEPYLAVPNLLNSSFFT